MKIDQNILAAAARILGTSPGSTALAHRYLDEADAFYVYVGVRGGGAVIIRSETEFLFATSAVPLQDHIEAFLAGRRTDPAILDRHGR